MIDFRLLGPVGIYRDGENVEVGFGKQRALLAVLLMNANEVVSGGALIDLLWGDPPPSAQKILQNCVVKLRRLLPEQRLLTRAHGYELRIEEGELDFDRWCSLIEEARRLAGGDDPAAALRLFNTAQVEWRGAALCDVGDVPFVAGETRRLDELWLDATMDRVDVQLALGRHGEVVHELEPLVNAHPLHERLRQQLMLALYRSGRQTDSLEVYREGRRILVDEIGVEPGPALRQLEQEILNQAPALEPPAGVPKHTLKRAVVRRRSVVLVAVALAAATASAAFGLIGTGSVAPRAGTPPNSVAVVDSATGHLTADLAVGTAPSSIAVASGSLWVANQGDESLTKIDVLHQTVSIPAIQLTTNGDSSITAVAIAKGGVWVVDSYVGSLTRIPVTALQQRFAPGYDLYRTVLPASDRYSTDYLTLTAGAGHLWITSSHFSAVFELSPGSAQVQWRIAVPGHPVAATAGQGSLWSVGALGGRGVVARIDAARHAVVARIVLPGTPAAVATGFGAVWVAIPDRNRLYKIDAATDAVVSAIVVPGSPVAVAAGAGGVWVVEGTGRRLLRLDPSSGAAVRTVALNGTPHGLAIADGRVWIVGA